MISSNHKVASIGSNEDLHQPSSLYNWSTIYSSFNISYLIITQLLLLTQYLSVALNRSDGGDDDYAQPPY